MNTIEWATKELTNKGWKISSIEYEKPSSGMMCIEGGYLCILDLDEDDYDYDYDIFRHIHVDSEKIFGTLELGIIGALYKDDFKKLINLIPTKVNNKEVK